MNTKHLFNKNSKFNFAKYFLILILGIENVYAFSTGEAMLVSFPKEVIPLDSGKIEFSMKISSYTPDTTISVGTGFIPFAYYNYPNSPWMNFSVGFDSNNGASGGGFIGSAGHGYMSGTVPYYQPITYGQLLGDTTMHSWHQYALVWNKDGVPGVDNGLHKLALYIDNQLVSSQWEDDYCAYDPVSCNYVPSGFYPLTETVEGYTHGKLALGLFEAFRDMSANYALDEFKIYDGIGNIVLYNSLDSASAVSNSIIGLNGTAIPGAVFIEGIKGNAIANVPLPGSIWLLASALTLIACNRRF